MHQNNFTNNKILQYLLEIEGREFSATHVLEYLKRENSEISTQTLYSYLEALCSTFIINKVNRYDVYGKSILKTLNKYYTSDLGIKKIKTNYKDINYSKCLENLVYNELVSRGYEVFVGKIKKGEVDFVVTKQNKMKYIQVTYMLSHETTVEREFGTFDSIDDNYEKYVISMDKANFSRKGVKHINMIEFLIGDEF